MFLSIKSRILSIIKRKINRQDIIDYIENELKVPLDHKSPVSESRYYKIGDMIIRISDHLQSKTKECVGITIIDGGAFIHIFDKIITITSLKELKFFLWSFYVFYGSKQIEAVFQSSVDIFKKKISEHDKLLKNYKRKVHVQKEELSKLNTINKNQKDEIQKLKNQIVTLHKKSVYLENINPNKKKKTTNNLASVRNKLKISDSVCEDLMDLIYKISEHLDKLPENLQSEILNMIGDYYDQK